MPLLLIEDVLFKLFSRKWLGNHYHAATVVDFDLVAVEALSIVQVEVREQNLLVALLGNGEDVAVLCDVMANAKAQSLFRYSVVDLAHADFFSSVPTRREVFIFLASVVDRLP